MTLPDDAAEKWVYHEHTKVKHEILSKYLVGWIKILGKFNNLNIFDCFAGRGRYAGGEEGSPLIIMRRLAEIRDKTKKPEYAACIFVEENANNFHNLREEVNKEIEKNPNEYQGWLETEFYNDEFANVANRIIAQFGRKLAPSFFFIDPFGFSGVPFTVISDILSMPKMEVFLTFMIRDLNRFLESPKHRISIEELYGMSNPIETLVERYGNLPREQGLLKLYRDQLHERAKVKYTYPFRVNADEKLQTTYHLIHATNHPLGCELMKGVMYRTGTEGRFGYLGPVEGQMTLTQMGGIERLKEYLLRRFAGRTITYRDVRYETLMETEFIEKHYRQAINDLEVAGRINVRGRGPRGGLSNDAEITFP